MEKTKEKNSQFRQTLRVFFGRGVIAKISFCIVVIFIAVSYTHLDVYKRQDQTLGPKERESAMLVVAL